MLPCSAVLQSCVKLIQIVSFDNFLFLVHLYEITEQKLLFEAQAGHLSKSVHEVNKTVQNITPPLDRKSRSRSSVN
jgi:hypothetical protein